MIFSSSRFEVVLVFVHDVGTLLESHPRHSSSFKLGIGVAACIGCLFRIGVIHGREVIKGINFPVNSGASTQRLSAIHAIVTMAGVKLCNPKYGHVGVEGVYRQLGSIYVEIGAYIGLLRVILVLRILTLLMVSPLC